MTLLDLYRDSRLTGQLVKALGDNKNRLHLTGLTGSLPSLTGAATAMATPDRCHLFIAASKEDALYMLNDIENLMGEQFYEIDQKRALLFPSSYRKPYQHEDTDNANILQRSEVVKQLAAGRKLIVVTYAEALCEKVISSKTLARNTLQISKGARLTADFVIDVLMEYGFDRVDFVVEPGQYAVRGGIIDVFSYANENPYRIEFFDEEIDSLRTFDPVSQLSLKQHNSITIIPNLECKRNRDMEAEERRILGKSLKSEPDEVEHEERVNLLEYFGAYDVVWTHGLMHTSETIERSFAVARGEYDKIDPNIPSTLRPSAPNVLYSTANEFLKQLMECTVVEIGNSVFFNKSVSFEGKSELQPVFNKQFDMLRQSLDSYAEKGYRLIICTSNEQQRRRLDKIFEAMGEGNITSQSAIQETTIELSLHHGFIDHQEKILCYTDHEIFERYYKYTVRDMRHNHEALTLKELFELKPGDYVTHIDYGVGRFSGLEKVTNNGRQQEVIRLTYKNNDTLYISIHGLHKISRYVGKDGVPPTMHRLGSSQWQALKQKTKRQVKDIAKDLIALYAKRKASKGFAFSPDSSLQNELEASFLYEDTPDQSKATLDVKGDMESVIPMDRLVCGDVGFGKTEVAIRAAFKAVCDSKQVAVLVPSTILAFQHYNTFCERLKGMPVNIDYLNRFRTAKEKKKLLADLESGKLDIIIGTHAVTGKDVKFHDLGLLIIDEEQKFGVSHKEKLRQMKVNVDCLTLTATPIPRTLQFSLMGARDLSVIQTPPPNRQPIQTEICSFDEEIIRDAIHYEMARGGQVFFVSNRVENLPEMTGLVQRLVPDATVAMAHGQMDGKTVEKILLQFVDGEIDVLVATSIIENGLDISNANTMIINNAHQFGLSDLHQMRGRVGRSNRKAFCYMLIPSYSLLSDEASKRLKAIEEFSTIGSGFNLAMRDLDIRGAGNILGAEQSGFISEIGYEMYQKILNEAIEELKESDFKELFAHEQEESREYVKECQIETDLEVLLPDSYVTSISERLLLYKELNALSTEEELDRYRNRLIDRFGPIPRATEELIETITLRQMAKDFGIEKLVLKGEKMICHLVSNQQSPFYTSPNFTKVIRFTQNHATESKLKETPDRLSLVVEKTKSIRSAIERLKELVS